MNNRIKEFTNLQTELEQKNVIIEYHNPNKGNFCSTFQHSKDCIFEVSTKNNQKYWITRYYHHKYILGLPVITYNVITVYDDTHNIISQATKWKKGYKKLHNLYKATEVAYEKQELSKQSVR